MPVCVLSHLLPVRADPGTEEEPCRTCITNCIPAASSTIGPRRRHCCAPCVTATVLHANGPAQRLATGSSSRFVLADALHVVAVEHGYRSWPVFKHDEDAHADADVRTVGRISAAPAADYAARAEELLDAARRHDAAAIARLQARVPRLSDLDAADIAVSATDADTRICLAREYGFRTWAELAESTDHAAETHYSLLPEESPWKQAATAIQAGDAARLRELLDEHPGLEHDDPGMTLLQATAQPEAGAVPRDVVDVLIEAGSELDVPLNLAACFDKADLVGWLLDAGADAAATPSGGSRRCRPRRTTAAARPSTFSWHVPA